MEQDNPIRLVDTICAHLPVISREKQELLETLSVPKRMRSVLELLHREIELMDLERDINAKVKKKAASAEFVGSSLKNSPRA